MHDEFLRLYGLAMGSWATIERELGTLFAFITRIDPALAMQLFYSARSFTGRVDMFRAALSAAPAPDPQKDFARLIINKCRAYNELRAKLAHDLPAFDYKGGVILVDGKAQFQSDELKKAATERAITMEQLATAANNFESLAKIIMEAWHEIVTSKTPSLDRYRERVLQLPDQAHTIGRAAPKKARQKRLPLPSPKKAPKEQ